MTNDETQRRQTNPRRGLITLIAGVVGVVAILGICEWMKWPFLRGPLASALEQTLNREVVIGPGFGVRFFGRISLEADAVNIGAPASGPAMNAPPPDFLNASQLRVALPYSTVLNLVNDDPQAPRKPIRITALEAATLNLNLLRDKAGISNWQFGERKQADARPLEIPEFGRLVVQQGSVIVDDALNQLSLDARLRTVSSKPGTGSPVGMEVDAKGRYRDQPLTTQLRFNDLQLHLPDEAREARTFPVWLKLRLGTTELDFDGSTKSATQFDAFGGKFRLAGPSLASVGRSVGITLPTTASFVMRGQVARNGQIWSADIAQLLVGSSRLNGNFRYDPTQAMPKLTGRLGGARLYMPDLGPAVGAPPPAPADASAQSKAGEYPRADQAPATQDRVLPQREFDIPSLAAMNANVLLAVDTFDLGTENLEPLVPLQTRIILQDQVLTLDELTARTAKGEVSGKVSLDANKPTPLWKADLRWSRIELERFVKPRNAATASNDRGYISGALSGRARVSGEGRSMARVLGSLDGDMQLWVRDGQISHILVEIIGLDIAQSLGMLVRGDDALPMQCAVAALDVRNGAVNSRIAVVETRDSTISAEGTISLATESLDLKLRASPKDISPMTIRTPLMVTGSFDDPDIKLEKKSIGLRLAGAAALAAITPLAGLLALIDLGDPEKEVCQEAISRIRAGEKASLGIAQPTRP